MGNLPPLGEVLEPLAADQIVPDEWNPETAPDDGPGSFVEIFRSSTPYIKMHQGCTMVIHLDTRVLDQEQLLDDLMDDVALIAVLGVLPVLVISIRDQVDVRLREMGVQPRFHGTRTPPKPPLPMMCTSLSSPFRSGALRISDQSVIRVVQEVSGFARSRVEAALARGRSRSSGARRDAGGGVAVDVVGGNLFFTAQPLGVRDGVDLGSTGEVRRVEVDKIRAHLGSGEIVLLGAIGYSASGDVFNVKSEEVAMRAAAALGASKLIFLTYGRLMSTAYTANATAADLADPGGGAAEGGLRLVQSMRLGEARRLVQQYAQPLESAEESCAAAADSTSCATASVLALCGYCVDALEKGVTRAHLVPPVSGALLKELYTLDGIGTLLSRDLYDGIRRAVPEDTPGIIELIQPLEEQASSPHTSLPAAFPARRAPFCPALQPPLPLPPAPPMPHPSTHTITQPPPGRAGRAASCVARPRRARGLFLRLHARLHHPGRRDAQAATGHVHGRGLAAGTPAGGGEGRRVRGSVRRAPSRITPPRGAWRLAGATLKRRPSSAVW